MFKPRFLLVSALSTALACSSSLDGASSSDDIQVQVPAAKRNLQRVAPAADGSLKVTQAPKFEQPLTVVLKLAGDPVAVVRGRAPSKRIASAAKSRTETAAPAP